MHFLAGICHYFEFMSAKDENNMVCCTLCAGDKVLSSFKEQDVKFEETFGVAAQLKSV